MQGEEVKKLYYTIGEVSNILQVNPSLIRYWEKEFVQIKPRKSQRGNRLFTISDLEVLKYIHYLVKVQKHTLDGAKKILKEKNKENIAQFKTLNTLLEVKKMLINFRNELSDDSINTTSN